MSNRCPFNEFFARACLVVTMKGLESVQDLFLWNQKLKDTKFKEVIRDKKILLLYYTSIECSETDKTFLPILKKIFKEAQNRKLGVEILFVSLDRNEDDMKNLFVKQHGPWYAIPYEYSDISKELQMKYNITSIPAIVALNVDNGDVISRNGKAEIEQLGINVLATWLE